MSKRMKIIFTVSVALNVLLLGVVAGHIGQKYKKAPWEGAALSEESQKKARQVFREFTPLKKDIWAKKRAMNDLLLADEFDEAVYDSLAMEAAQLKQEIEIKRSAAMKDVLTELSPEERQALVEHMSKRIEKRIKRHEKWGRKGREREKKRAE